MGGRFLGGGTGGGFHGVQSTAVFAVAWVVAGSEALRAFCISTQADRAQHGSGSLLSAAAEPGEGGRTGAYKARFATSTCWEFDALAPDVIADLIRQEIVGIVDQRARTKAELKEARPGVSYGPGQGLGAMMSNRRATLLAFLVAAAMAGTWSGSAGWSEIHPDRLTSNRIEAQSELNRIEWGNHEKGKEARQIQDFIETTS